MDYTYPLPKAALHKRYDPVFSGFQRGRSVTLIGLPQSARSGYLKFILEFDPKFLSEFIDLRKFHFIVLEDSSVSADQLIHIITAKIISLGILPPKPVSLLENRLRIHDSYLTLVSLKSVLSEIYPQHRLVIVLYEAEKMLKDNPQAVNFIKNLWDTNRNQPDSQVSLCFIGSPVLLELKNIPHFLPLRPALEETLVYFPLFSSPELSYLRKRLEYLSGSPIPDKIHKLASVLSAGHTVLYRLLTQLSETEITTLSHIHSHPSVDSLLNEIWLGIPALNKQNWNRDYPFYLPLLPPRLTWSENITPLISLPLLTAQQRLLFNYLNSHQSQIVTRDELAQVLWGRLWQQKYSDWAIDQAVSKLKKKLISANIILTVIRNRGYLLSLK